MQRIEHNPDALIVNTSQVFLNPSNSRKTITPELEKKIDDIANSMQQTDIGLLQPILVRPRKWGPSDIPQYENIAGDCRLMAAQRAGLSKIPIIIKNVDNRTARRINLMENIHRSELGDADMGEALVELKNDMQTELDEYLATFTKNAPNQKLQGATYEKMKKDFLHCPNWITRLLERYENSSKTPKVSWDDVAAEVGFTDPRSIHYYIAISKLSPEILQEIADGNISQHQARAIAQLKDPTQQRALVQQIKEQGLTGPQAAKAAQELKAPTTKGALHPTNSGPTPLENMMSNARKITSQIAQLRRDLEALHNDKGDFSEKFRQEFAKELNLWGANGESIVSIVQPIGSKQKGSRETTKTFTSSSRKVRLS